MSEVQPASVRPPLPPRIKVAIGATVVTLVLIVEPGQMALPLNALFPFLPHVGGCANLLAGAVVLAYFGLAFVVSVALFIVGILAVVGTALRNRFGLAGAVAFNAIVAALLLMEPLSYPSHDPAALGLYWTLTVCAVAPLTAVVLLLSPTVFGSWWHSGGPFVATVVVAGLLLLPGAAGTVEFGLQLSMPSSPPAAISTSTALATC